MRLSITLGFVTNSSSAIHHFPAELLKHPKVQAFLTAFEVTGFVGECLWSRSTCTTIALTKEQKQEAQDKLNGHDYGEDLHVPGIDVNSTDFVVIYGDEYESIAKHFAHLCSEVLAEIRGGNAHDHFWSYTQYN